MASGADRLCDVLLANGVDVCFANPGTSEMHFVAALDRRPEMRCILGLFEGVATGAADGYGRMTGRPAATLLHTGPGLGNGFANLHNGRRARSPILNVVGDHASFHLRHNAPLTTDIDAIAATVSDWVDRAAGPDDVGATAEAAYLAALRPGVATLILPADSAWGEVASPAPLPAKVPARPAVASERIRDVAEAIRASRGQVGIVVGNDAAKGEGLATAGQIAAACGGRLWSEVIPPRVERGRGRADAARIPYPIDHALAALAGTGLLVLCGAPEPVAFFAYPGKPGRLVPDDAIVMTLADCTEDQPRALSALAAELGTPPTQFPVRTLSESTPAGPLTDDAIAVLLAQLMPANAIVIDEGLTAARRFYELGAAAAPHDLLMTSGGAIGFGIPAAIGAAVACPDRKVIGLQADGSAMYTLQGLWTQARENLDVLTLILSNRRYAILEIEMANLGFNDIGRNASRMMSLDNPPLDWVALARGMGVEAVRTDTCEGLRDLLAAALPRRGPFLIECAI